MLVNTLRVTIYPGSCPHSPKGVQIAVPNSLLAFGGSLDAKSNVQWLEKIRNFDGGDQICLHKAFKLITRQRRSIMPEHHAKAAKHHLEAAKHHEAGKHETAAHHALMAHGHHLHALHHEEEAAKMHAEKHSKV
ncbi:MAG: hypothetical protein WB662_18435 [Methyloceanibacter sp.]